MSIPVDVLTALKSHSGLSLLVGSKIYRVRLPQGVTYPAILCRFNYEPISSLLGTNKTNVTAEFEIYAATLAATEQIQEQLELALLESFKCVLLDVRDDDFLDQNNMYSVFSEYSIWK